MKKETARTVSVNISACMQYRNVTISSTISYQVFSTTLTHLVRILPDNYAYKLVDPST